MKYEKSCGAIIFTKENNEFKYLIIEQIEKFHSFPKGHVEEGETELETATREIYEEVGLKPKFIEGFRTVDNHLLKNRPDTIKSIVYFLAEADTKNVLIQESELLDASFMTYEEAINILEHESSKRVLTEAAEFLKNMG